MSVGRASDAASPMCQYLRSSMCSALRCALQNDSTTPQVLIGTGWRSTTRRRRPSGPACIVREGLDVVFANRQRERATNARKSARSCSLAIESAVVDSDMRRSWYPAGTGKVTRMRRLPPCSRTGAARSLRSWRSCSRSNPAGRAITPAEVPQQFLRLDVCSRDEYRQGGGVDRRRICVPWRGAMPQISCSNSLLKRRSL